jgi:VanZ family protein
VLSEDAVPPQLQNKKMKFLRTIYPTLIWFCLIWILSSLPSQHIPSVNIAFFDKLEHIGVYVVLSCLLGYWLSFKDWKLTIVILIYLFLLLLAGLDEYHQTYIPGREVSLYDFMANSAGIIIGFLFFLHQNDRS